MDFPKKIMLNNGAWVKEMTELRPNFFKRFETGQHPQALWIGCSDSRVPPEEITGLQAGDLFVHRNVANLFSAADKSVMSVLQYAVEALKVPYIVICGHQGCGEVLAAVKGSAEGHLKEWLAPIAELHPEETDEDEIQRFTRANVEASVHRLSQTEIIQKAWHNGEGPILLGWYYETFTGRLIEQVQLKPQSAMKVAQDLGTKAAAPLKVSVS